MGKTNAELAAQLKDDADFLEGITPGGIESTEIIARVRLAAQRLEGEISEAKHEAIGDATVYAAADAILRAAGSGMRFYTMPGNREKILKATRDELEAAREA